jgi:hypothetical protein
MRKPRYPEVEKLKARRLNPAVAIPEMIDLGFSNAVRIASGLSLQDFTFECHAFGVIFLEPCFRGVDVCEHLEMLRVTDPLGLQQTLIS